MLKLIWLRLCLPCYWGVMSILVHPIMPVSAAPFTDTGIEVWGVAYDNLVLYPERGLDSRALVDALVVARNEYPLEMTLEQINSLADVVTRLYRDNGYKFHRVIVPPQKPRQGLIEFSVLDARLGDIHVHGKGVDTEAIENVFKQFLQQPLYQPDIDRRVQALKAQRGIDAVAYYSRGAKKGEVRLNLKVEQQSIKVYSQLDNYGSESTGRDRLMVGGNWYSPFGRLDNLSVGVMAANSEERNHYGYINYSSPLWDLDNQLSLNLSNNQFALGEEFSSLEFDGDARIAELKYERTLSRSWQGQQKLSVAGTYKSADYRSLLKDPSLERDEVSRSLWLGWSIDYQAPSRSYYNQFSIQAMSGEYRVDGLFDEERKFNKYQINNRYQFSWGDAGENWSSHISHSVRAQYSDDIIPSFEKIVLTGSSGVRAFKPGYFSAERGAITSLEWRFPWLLEFTDIENFSVIPMVFIDAGYGEKVFMGQKVIDRAFLAGAGLGLTLSMGEYWALQVVGAKELEQDVNSGLPIGVMDAFMQLNFYY